MAADIETGPVIAGGSNGAFIGSATGRSVAPADGTSIADTKANWSNLPHTDFAPQPGLL